MNFPADGSTPVPSDLPPVNAIPDANAQMERILEETQGTLRGTSIYVQHLKRENELLNAGMRVVRLFERLLDLSLPNCVTCGDSPDCARDLTSLADRLDKMSFVRRAAASRPAPDMSNGQCGSFYEGHRCIFANGHAGKCLFPPVTLVPGTEPGPVIPECGSSCPISEELSCHRPAGHEGDCGDGNINWTRPEVAAAVEHLAGLKEAVAEGAPEIVPAAVPATCGVSNDFGAVCDQPAGHEGTHCGAAPNGEREEWPNNMASAKRIPDEPACGPTGEAGEPGPDHVPPGTPNPLAGEPKPDDRDVTGALLTPAEQRRIELEQGLPPVPQNNEGDPQGGGGVPVEGNPAAQATS